MRKHLFHRIRFISPVSLIFAFLLLLPVLMAPPAAAGKWGETFRFSVTGSGEVKAVPDMAQVRVGVQTRAKTAAEALQGNTAAMRRVFDLLKGKFGIEEKDMATGQFSIRPLMERFEPKPGQPVPPPRVVGYEVTNMLNVRVRDLDKLGAILDAVVQDGANRLEGVSFGFSDRRKLLDQARREAVADAKARAKLYAEAVGFELGPVVEVREEGGVRPLPLRRGMVKALALAREAAPVPIARGEQSVSVSVTIVWLARSE